MIIKSLRKGLKTTDSSNHYFKLYLENFSAKTIMRGKGSDFVHDMRKINE